MTDSVLRDATELLVTGPDAGVLRLGLLLPLSGPLGLTGPSGLSAARLAAIEVNAAGRGVELVPVDAGRRPEEVAAEARFLAGAGLVQAFVGAGVGAESIAVLSFLGFDGISTLAEENRESTRAIGRSMVAALVLVGLLFIRYLQRGDPVLQGGEETRDARAR
ncbi:ABC transporter substrate-binding protein [Actinomadura geliboluensis]|uniref:ABC transporter substrate-binding protein n=1 Tax=Actinomadura geliboluensis TaxID=882440 RepID=UPI0036B0EED3